MPEAQRVIGHYRVTDKLGEGGMGEVWQATDTRLNREVAVKVLPAAVAGDSMRMARFAREAQVLASLNHPGIAAIYGVEERALVMELVPGPTLAERIARGPMPLDEALPIAVQIAEAMEYAHDKGVIHRDLKPANIKVTPEGRVKVLDFGLAKAMTSEASAAAAEAPTLTSPATLAGTVMGTAAYMAPEQARGQNVDRRADIWAFGVVLYEMLTGERPFGGPTISDTLAAVLRAEPELDKAPPEVRPLLAGCLRKDPRQRCQCIGDVRLALGAGAPLEGMAGMPARTSHWKPWLLGAAAVVVAAGVAAFTAWRLRAASIPPPAVVRFTVAMPANETLTPGRGGVAIAPDGDVIAFLAIGPDGSHRIFLRRLSQTEATAVPDSNGAHGLFFSPDSQWIAFSNQEGLQRAPVSGGTPVPICKTCSEGASAWGADGMIYFADAGKIHRVAASGGAPSTIAGLQPPLWLDDVLPGGGGILYSFGSRGQSGDDSGIAVQSPPGGKGTVLLQGGTGPRYLAGGYLIYAQGGRLLAAPFDLQRQKLTAAAFPVMEDVMQGTGGYAGYAIARNGTLVYVNGGEQTGLRGATAEWVDGSGVGHAVSHGVFWHPQLSPDGKRVAFEVRKPGGADIWTLDLAHGTLTRLTFAKQGQWDEDAVWTPDGKDLIYASFGDSSRAPTLAERAADGSGAEHQLFTSQQFVFPQCVTPDGKFLLFASVQRSHPDLWRLPLTGGGKPTPVIQSGFATFEAQLSPDGRWLAYVSTEDGSPEVFVRPYPSLAGKWQISVKGGSEPRWSHDGRQLFYRAGDQMMAVAVDGRAGFSYSAPRQLFDQPFAREGVRATGADYAVAADGRFLMLKPDPLLASGVNEQLHVVLNWGQEVRRLAKH